MLNAIRILTTVGLAVLSGSVLAACSDSTAGRDGAQAQPITDAAYLTAPFWNDGQAEIAFYRLHRSRNQYDQPADQQFLVGTYLVKQDFDPSAQSKARPGASSAVSAFKYALFYEFESGSYEYKRSYVINARQQDLVPLKASFTSFDWCSNLYREQAFLPGGEVDYVMRSDDYGNERTSYPHASNSYPVASVPLLVRGLDFEDSTRHTFAVLLESGDVVSVQADLVGVDTVRTEAGELAADRIDVRYDQRVPSPFAEETDESETYWRGTGPDRLLVAVEGASGRYRMELVEAVRSAYWEDDVYEQLVRVRERP